LATSLAYRSGEGEGLLHAHKLVLLAFVVAGGYTVKKLFDIPVSRPDVTYQTLPGENNDVIYKLFPPRVCLVSDILTGDGNIKSFFSVYRRSIE
jgi:hypothetical protein